MKRTLLGTAIVIALLAAGMAHAGGDFNEAEDASAIMVAITVCKTSVSEELKRVLYAKMLSVMRTPSQINWKINQEIEAITTLPASDRTAMCMAIGDRVKELEGAR
jgi:hypothetical protein